MATFSPTSRSALAQLSTRKSLPLVSQVAIRVAYLVLLWSQRSRTRNALTHLSDASLRDIGLTPEDAHREAGKWFWRP